MAGGGQASAQECADTERLEAAREAMAQWQLARAAELLRASLDACPARRTAHNLAGVLRELGQPTAALAILDDLIRGTYGELGEDEVAAAREQRLQTLQTLATLDVLVEGAEAGRVSVDGREVASFRGGERRTIRLDPGEHRLRLRAPTFLAIDREVTLAPGATDEIAVSFPEGDQGLLVLSGPPGIALSVDGRARGTESVRLRLPAGPHAVAAEGLGERTVELRGGTIVENVFTEPPVPLRRRAWFWALVGGSAIAVAVAVTLGILLPIEPQSVAHPVLGNQET
ncbi:MAG: hypothetical protein CMN30_11940 [Sandaracinus sp.]|nr:hypothetical protein [Sandaracinus sp.]|tara:strand:- start:1129 stop:1983 length:855 start_codon:yes stop_codon:yes gene_type:complete